MSDVYNHICGLVFAGLLGISGVCLLGCSSGSPEPANSMDGPQIYTYRVIDTYPHDRNAFTQGLVFENGFLYEGTGLHGRSTLRKVALETGELLRVYELPEQYFGEGITIYNGEIVQLTWQSKTGFVYDKASFKLLREFSYETEGWGITYDGKQLIMSDGTATLYFLEPETFTEVGRIEVADSEGPVEKLNELEYINGEILANVWETDRIVRIEPETGRVSGWIDLKGLLDTEANGDTSDVLNGIAYDRVHECLFVTGKLWPAVYKIELVPLK